jgi:hypothetical protein
MVFYDLAARRRIVSLLKTRDKFRSKGLAKVDYIEQM